MNQPSRKPKLAALRIADARRAGRAAIETGCAVEVTTPTGLRFRFTPLGETKPEPESEYDAWKRDEAQRQARSHG